MFSRRNYIQRINLYLDFYSAAANNCSVISGEFKEIGSDIMSKELITTQMNVNNKLVRVMRVDNVDYISLTDLAKYQNENDPSGVIRNWMSNKNSFDFIIFGKNYIMKILIPWNHTELKSMKLNITVLL